MRTRRFYRILLLCFLLGCKLRPHNSGPDIEGQRQATLRAIEFCHQKGMDLDVAKWGAPNPREIPCTAPVTPNK